MVSVQSVFQIILCVNLKKLNKCVSRPINFIIEINFPPLCSEVHGRGSYNAPAL